MPRAIQHEKLPKVKEHWCRPILRMHHVPLAQIAQYIQRSYPLTCSVLTGAMPASPDVERRLCKLVAKLEGV